jgi:hypothetical protein
LRGSCQQKRKELVDEKRSKFCPLFTSPFSSLTFLCFRLLINSKRKERRERKKLRNEPNQTSQFRSFLSNLRTQRWFSVGVESAGRRILGKKRWFQVDELEVYEEEVEEERGTGYGC